LQQRQADKNLRPESTFVLWQRRPFSEALCTADSVGCIFDCRRTSSRVSRLVAEPRCGSLSK
jgi:hypothetical protein